MKSMSFNLAGAWRAPLVLFAALAAGPAVAQDGAASLALPAPVELVGPGVVSGPFHDFAPSLTPDGKTLLFTRTDAGFSRMTLMQSQLAGGQWQAPTVLPFSGRWNDGDGVLSPDGKRYVFISNRPAQGNTPKADLDLWQVLRQADGTWGEPQRLPDHINTGVNEIYPSIAADGTLYFGRAGGGNPIFRAPLAGGSYQQPEKLPFNGFSFAVAPDQSFGIVGQFDASNRNSDLYYVARPGGQWAAPVRLEGPVNAPQPDFAGSITPDGKALLFVSTRSQPQAWPRQQPVKTAAEVTSELQSIQLNGLRNIYKVDISTLPAAGK